MTREEHSRLNRLWYQAQKTSNPIYYQQRLQKSREYCRVNAKRLLEGKAKWALKNPARKLLITIKRTAKVREFKFNLTREWLELKFKSQNNRCSITKIKFQQIGKRNPFQPSIDRIDCSKGYIQSNCQLVCLIYNYAKGTWSHKDVIKFARSFK